MALLDTAHTMYTGQYLLQPGYPQPRLQHAHYYRDYQLQCQAARVHASPEHYGELHSRLHPVKEEQPGHMAAFKPYSPGQENLSAQANVLPKVWIPYYGGWREAGGSRGVDCNRARELERPRWRAREVEGT